MSSARPVGRPDRTTLTNADQHKASAAEADRGLTRRGGKGGWPLDGENRRPRLRRLGRLVLVPRHQSLAHRNHHHDLLHAPQLLGRVELWIERWRLLRSLLIRIILAWLAPRAVHDHAGADAAHALVLGLKRQPAHLFCRGGGAFAVNLLDFGKELHQSLAIIRATASVRRWRAVELFELLHECVVSGHSDLASLV